MLCGAKLRFLLSFFCNYAVISDAIRFTHVPKACITAEGDITHEVRTTFRKERITQKSLLCPVDKRDFFVVYEFELLHKIMKSLLMQG